MIQHKLYFPTIVWMHPFLGPHKHCALVRDGFLLWKPQIHCCHHTYFQSVTTYQFQVGNRKLRRLYSLYWDSAFSNSLNFNLLVYCGRSSWSPRKSLNSKVCSNANALLLYDKTQKGYMRLMEKLSSSLRCL